MSTVIDILLIVPVDEPFDQVVHRAVLGLADAVWNDERAAHEPVHSRCTDLDFYDDAVMRKIVARSARIMAIEAEEAGMTGIDAAVSRNSESRTSSS